MKIFRAFLVILLLILLNIQPDLNSPMDVDQLYIYCFLFLGMVCYHMIIYSKLYRNWFRMDVLFLIGFGIVHFQWPIMLALSGIAPDLTSRVWVDENYVNYGTWLSTIGACSWLLGFSVINTTKKTESENWRISYGPLLIFTIFLFVLFLFTVDVSFFQGGQYKPGGGNNSSEGAAIYIRLILSCSIIILTALVLIANKDKYSDNIIRWFFQLDTRFIFLFFSYILVFLLVGDRGGPISLVITACIVVGTVIRPIKFGELVVTTFSGAILLTLVSLGRGEAFGLGIFNAGAQKFELVSGYDPTLELANSVRTLYRALIEVPAREDFFYGRLWMGNLLAPIPFLQSIYINLTGVPKHELGSAAYITFLTYGKDPSSGEGSTIVADIYLNFSTFGVSFFLVLLGAFFKIATNNLLTLRKFNWIIVVAILASISLYLSRSELLIMLRPIVWGWMLVLLFVKKNKIES